MRKILLTLCLAGSVFNFMTADACTTLIINDTKGAVYQGRTLEFGDGIPPLFLNFYPKGFHFTAYAQSGQKPLSYDAKYAFFGIAAKIDKSNKFTIADGMNGQGLTVTLNMFGPSRGTSSTAKNNILDADSIGKWILSQFSTTAEVKQALNNQPIWFEPTAFGAPFPFHIAVFDQSGKGIVIEFVNGKLMINDNPIGVMTNAPEFNWHLTNLNNYTTLNNVGSESSQWNDYKLHAVDIGGNTLGLPSDDTSFGRFVRAAFISNYAEKPIPANAVATLGKIMNKFDRVKGVTRTMGADTEASASLNGAKSSPAEWTIFTTLRDLNNKTYYIRTENNLNYAQFNLNKATKSSQAFSIPFIDLYQPNIEQDAPSLSAD